MDRADKQVSGSASMLAAKVRDSPTKYSVFIQTPGRAISK